MKVFIKEKGVLQGTTIIDSGTKTPKCHRFSRVPYALPPIGSRRWRKPEPLPASFSYGSESEPGQYTKESLMCPQLHQNPAQNASYSEDCLQLNIWVPIGEAPEKGWPVLFYIHGGFLQYGSNNSEDPSSLLAETDVKCIVVAPNYRLGVFGFLASKELCYNQGTSQHEFGKGIEANFGFWDQRLALEWTYENISCFGGNEDNITVAGLSAGAYSTLHQLAHDIGCLNLGKQIIRRVLMMSNGCGVQPKQLIEAQPQFDELVRKLKLGTESVTSEKCIIEELRQVPVMTLIRTVGKMDSKFICPILDDQFIDVRLFQDIYSGKFGMRMKELGIEIMIGDLTQEYHLYKTAFPPKSYKQLVSRLNWNYPEKIVNAICAPYKGNQTRTSDEWADIFGKLYADMQIHSTMRGFVQSIAQTLPQSCIHRYRIDWRTESVDKRLPRKLGATHTTDLSIWFFGNGDTLTAPEKRLIKEWLVPIAEFVKGKKTEWYTNDLNQVRYLTKEGTIKIKDDEVWVEKLPLWELTQATTQEQNSTRAKYSKRGHRSLSKL